jgi:hypothetical protein
MMSLGYRCLDVQCASLQLCMHTAAIMMIQVAAARMNLAFVHMLQADVIRGRRGLAGVAKSKASLSSVRAARLECTSSKRVHRRQREHCDQT